MKNTVAKQTDISRQIQQYLNGELDAKVMHRLEREALNDPFLADALEGYAGAKANQQSNLDDITARLQSRVDKKIRTLIPWKLISAAASVIVVLTIGGLWIYNSDQPAQKEAKMVMLDKIEIVKPETLKAPVPQAENKQAAVSAPPVAEPRIAAVRKQRIVEPADPSAGIIVDETRVAAAKAGQNFSKAKPFNDSPTIDILTDVNAGYTTTLRKDSVSLEDRIVSGFFDAPVADKAGLVAAAKPEEKALQGRVAGVQVTQLGNNLHNPKIINGRVVDNGVPLPGATITIKGTGIAAQTDADGKFKIPAVKDKSELEINYLGYLTQQVSVKKEDTLLIAMQPDNKQSLNEVVVVGYGTKVRNHKAMPVGGWDKFKQYLKEDAISQDGKKGTVKISFIVQTDGKLTDFKILKSISKETDEKAISLIKDGPEWLSNSNGKPQPVTISIKFIPEE